MKKDKIIVFCTLFALLSAGSALAGESPKKQKEAVKEATPSPQMYSWEEARSAIPSYTDMVLCYGGSHHRTPYRWDKERFGPFVSYVDTEGQEHWLFDSFLCLEFQDSSRPDGQNYAYSVGSLRGMGISAGKKQWGELIDYWFDSKDGLTALDHTIGEVAKRIGGPTAKRKVLMVMPDPIIFRKYDDTTEATDYWGNLNGKKLDFANGEDRVAAYKWYVDEVRKRFDKQDYKYIELAGFYPISEEIVTPGDGYCHELKRSEEIIPQIAAYLHSVNESLCWIPYNRAAGYTKWNKMGVDYAYMQPNHYWDDKGDRPLPRFFSDIKANNLAMEFEFEDTMLEGNEKADIYKKRFREYLTGAKKYGVYGTKPLSYYQGTNALYDLWKSDNPKDQAIYHEFCEFVIGNPLRNNTK